MKLARLVPSLFLVLLHAPSATGRDPYGSTIRESTSLTGPIVFLDALQPTVRKAYLPQYMFRYYQGRQWETTNYARDLYKEYNPFFRSGDQFYDSFGNYVTTGWSLYSWQREQPHLFGSTIVSDLTLGDGLFIASDSKGGSMYTITIGRDIRTLLTPMTFSKPDLDGIQWDVLTPIGHSDWAGTVLLSRISGPLYGPELRETANLLGGRLVGTIGGLLKLGTTYVNAHYRRTDSDFAIHDLFRGQLVGEQLKGFVDKLVIRLGDHSPSDGEKGAWLFDKDILITDIHGRTIRGKDIGFYPSVEGGVELWPILKADGDEEITLTYDLKDPSYTGPPPSQIRLLSLELDLANDYRVEITSNRQANEVGQPIFLPIAWGKGNAKDESNRRRIRFDYGLPTATEVYGMTVELPDIHGLMVLGEFDVSRTHRQYPNVNLQTPHHSVTQATGGYLNLCFQRYPGLAALELFTMDKAYSTTAFANGMDEMEQIKRWYELVEDNDDGDILPDWPRGWRPADPAVFPGLDENNDLIPDFNQNDNPARPNYVPDFEEPFLRYSVDSPEFLFGMDMNHNGWIDRFENDMEADYPYKKDHRGANLYVRYDLRPDIRLTVGRLREHLIFGDGRNHATYVLFTLDRDHPRLGRVRFFEDLRKVRDTIPDPLLQWTQPPRSQGYQREVPDPLSARNTWINTTFLQFDVSPLRNLNLTTKLKAQLYHQRDPFLVVEQRRARINATFFGWIGKGDYTLRLGRLVIQPKWKATYRREAPYPIQDLVSEDLEGTVFLLASLPVLRASRLELGLELTRYTQIRGPIPPMYDSMNYTGKVFALQITNLVDHYGYRLTTQLGYRLDWKTYDDRKRSSSTAFLSVFAGRSEGSSIPPRRGHWD